MIRYLIRRRLDTEERKLGQSIDYLRYIVQTSLRAFFKFVKIMPFAKYRRVLPKDAYYVAQIVAMRSEDCGTCLQIVINLAKQEGVATDLLNSVLARQIESLPPELSDVYLFTESVVIEKSDDVSLRQRLIQHYGEEGLVELAMAIASCRVFPTTKRALGFATSCSQIQIEVKAE